MLAKQSVMMKVLALVMMKVFVWVMGKAFWLAKALVKL